MSLDSIREEIAVRFAPPGWLWVAAIAGVVIGVAAVVVGFVIAPLDTWLWLVLWFLIFGGLAQGALLWSAAFRVAQARWTPAVNRLGHAAIWYLPVSFLVLILLLTGVRSYVPWTTHVNPEKAAWLNVPFMWVRDLALVGILSILSFLMVRWSLKTDANVARGEGVTPAEHYRLTAISVAVVLTYVVTFSILSYDFIMSLSPEWYSTMFAPYYWITNAYASLAGLIILSALLRRPLGVMRYLEPQQFTDMGNLMLAFSLFIMGLFFAQYLTIWYGNLPEETFFLIIRYYKTSWAYLGWAGFFLGYAIPFVVLQSRALKRRPVWLSIVAAIAIVGVTLERYVLIVPSVEPAKLALSPIPAIGGLAFLGFFVLAVMLFLRRYPPISSAQEALRDIEQRLEALR